MRQVNRLTQDQVKALLEAPDGKRHADGAGLYLDLRKNSAGAFNASWLYRYTMPGDKWPRDWDQGSAREVLLKDVRRWVAGYNADRARGLNPKTQEAIQLVKAKAEEKAQESRLTFRQAYDAAEANILAGYRNDKGRKGFKSRIKDHCGALWPQYVDAITPAEIAECVRAKWNQPVGNVIRGDIEKIFKRTGDHNPASKALVMGKLWKPQLAETVHRKAIEWKDAPSLIAKLRGRNTDVMEARAAELMILTGTRVEEVCGATRREFDLDRNFWTLSAKRTKTNRTHIIPLCDRAAAIVREMMLLSKSDYLFTAPRGGKMYAKRLRELIHGLGYIVDNHGFRTCLRTWVAVHFPQVPWHVQEMTIAHRVKGSSKAYLDEKPEDRRHIMTAYNGFLSA